MVPRGRDPLSVGSSGSLRGGGHIPGGTEKVLQVVSSHLPNKVARSITGTTGWVFLIALKANMDSALHDAPGDSV